MRISTRFLTSLVTSAAWWFGIAASLVMYLLAAAMAEDKNEALFNYHADNARVAVQARVQSYIDVLRGTAALFATRDEVTRDTFRAYVRELDLEHSFPGINNLNVAFRVPAADAGAFIATVREDRSIDPDGHPEFDIHSRSGIDEHHVLTYIEPTEGNLQYIGLDLAGNPAVAEALAAARDSGLPASSSRLVGIEGAARQVALAIRIPVYRRGMALDTVDARRAAYLGSVGAGINLKLLMSGAVDDKTQQKLRVRVYDASAGRQSTAGPGDSDRLLLETAGAGFSADGGEPHVKRIAMHIGPRVWEAEISAGRKAFANPFDAYLPWIVLIGGLAGCTLLYSIYYSMMSARRRAVELAQEMTHDLRNSEASLAEAQHMAHLGSWMLEPQSRRMTWSAETSRIFGFSHFRAQQHYDDFLRRIHGDDRMQVRAGLERVLESGEEFNAEHRIICLDGSLRWVQLIARRGQAQEQQLVRGTIMDITDRKQTVEALQRSRALLRELTAYQDRVKEEERKRIAREIHDELGQTLLALRIDVSMLEARTKRGHPRLNEKVRGALEHIDATVKTVRTIINNLRPAVLDLGLTAAFEWQVTEFRRRSGIGCELRMDAGEFDVDDQLATSLFRILQESLTNVIRHADASYVLIELYRQDARLVMKITDNGIGIDAGRRRSGNSFGLIGVEERVNALNGEFSISSAPGRGTTLIIRIPLAAAPDTDEAGLSVGDRQAD